MTTVLGLPAVYKDSRTSHYHDILLYNSVHYIYPGVITLCYAVQFSGDRLRNLDVDRTVRR